MPDLYAITTSPAALADLFKASAEGMEALPPHYAVFPGDAAPVIRNGADDERAVDQMRWGLAGQAGGGKPVTTIHDVTDPQWHDRLTLDYRCLIPVTAFCEYAQAGKEPNWFARDEIRTTFALAGVWMPCPSEATGDRSPLFAILTTLPNEIVQPVNAEAMPVVLAEDDWETWLEGDMETALALVRPAPSDAVVLVAAGEERDPPESRMGYQ